MTESDEPVLVREATSWGVRLVLNRPAKLNALGTELRDALSEAVADAAADDRVRVIAIAGAGRAFCSGYDLSEAAPPTAWQWPATWLSPPRGRSSASRRSASDRRPSPC